MPAELSQLNDCTRFLLVPDLCQLGLRKAFFEYDSQLPFRWFDILG